MRSVFLSQVEYYNLCNSSASMYIEILLDILNLLFTRLPFLPSGRKA